MTICGPAASFGRNSSANSMTSWRTASMCALTFGRSAQRWVSSSNGRPTAKMVTSRSSARNCSRCSFSQPGTACRNSPSSFCICSDACLRCCFSSGVSASNSCGLSTSPLCTGASARPIGVRRIATSRSRPRSCRVWNPCSWRSLNCSWMTFLRLRYSSLSKAAGRAARSSSIRCSTSSRSGRARPAGSRSVRGLCGSLKLLT